MSYQLIPIPEWPLEDFTLRFLSQPRPPKVVSNDCFYICTECADQFNYTFTHGEKLLKKPGHTYSNYCEIKRCPGPRAIMVHPASMVIYPY